MPDATVTLRQGETRPVYASATLPGGILYITGTPTVRVYTADGLQFTADVPDISGDPGETVQAIYTVDASDSGPFTAGNYVLIFTIATGASDSLSRTFEPLVTVEITAADRIVFTYDQAALAQGLGSAPGRLALTRLLLADTVDSTTQPAIYTDAEIAAYLALAGQDPYEAAAQAYEGMAASRGRIAQVMSQQGITVHRQALKYLTDMAATMRNRKNQGQLQIGNIEVETPGETLDSFRRSWADFAQVPEVR